MLTPATIVLRKLMRRTLVSALMIAVAGMVVASKGGGGEKKTASIPMKTNFEPIRTTNGFTLKAGPSYTGSFVLGTEKTPEHISFHTLITYEKGNSIYIMPYKYKLNSSMYLHNSGNNLQLLDLRINMHK